MNKVVEYWTKKSSANHTSRIVQPPPCLFLLRTFVQQEGQGELFEEKDHSSKLALGKQDAEVPSSYRKTSVARKGTNSAKSRPKVAESKAKAKKTVNTTRGRNPSTSK